MLPSLCCCPVPLCLLFLAIEAPKGISLGPILEKFNSLRTAGKKGTITAIEYQLLVTATNNFHDDTILGEGGCGRVYRAHFSDQYQAAVKKLQGEGQEADREFEVLNTEFSRKFPYL